MGYQQSELSLRVRLHPKEAAKQILDGFRRADGQTVRAAELLGVTDRTLDRWVARLGLRHQVEEIRRKAPK